MRPVVDFNNTTSTYTGDYLTAEPPFALCGPFARFSSSVASMTQVILSSATDDHQSALLGEERDRWRYCVYNCNVDVHIQGYLY